jgi:large subunit ribosomal protein L21
VKIRYLLIGFALGLLVAWWWANEEEQGSPLAAAAPTKPPVHRASSAQTKDPLVEIEGIGPAYERALNALGIFTFAQLAAQNADSLASQLSARVTAERIRRERWIEQAAKRAK